MASYTSSMLSSSTVKLLTSSLAVLLLVMPSAADLSGQAESPTLAGTWQIEFTLASPHRVVLNAQASGEGSFLTQDAIDAGRSPLPQTKATWSLRGQSPAIYYFVIAGEFQFYTPDGGIESGRLELSASADLTLPITSLRGWGQFHSFNIPNDGRGSEDPIFDFTASRAESFSVRVLSPTRGQKLRRGREYTIEWVVESPLPLASQEVLLSFDNGLSFILIASGLDNTAREFVWTLPETIPKTKKALIKVVARNSEGAVGEGMTEGTFRIK